MSTLRKVYRFRMTPTAVQTDQLRRMANARRFVWNWALQQSREHYATTGGSLPFSQLSAALVRLKAQPATAWLQAADSQSLQQAIADLQTAFRNFFARRSRYPTFKSRKRDTPRFRIPQRVRVANGQIYVPKVGLVRIRQSRDVQEATKSATFRLASDGHWYVTLTVEFDMPDVALPAPQPAAIVGIDLGLKDFAVLSTGQRIPAPQFCRKAERKLKRAQRSFSRRQRGSKRREKAKRRIARLHHKISNQRGDFLHKLSTRLVTTYAGLCIENLAICGLARTKLSKSVLDAAMGEFRRQLTYKSLWYRKHLAIIPRFYPSSQRCSSCGAINRQLHLADRQWTCDCGQHHDRDHNAANNIRDEGLRILAAGYADSQNARGVRVRPVTAGSGRRTENCTTTS